LCTNPTAICVVSSLWAEPIKISYMAIWKQASGIKAHIHMTIDRERIERMKKDYHHST
jgi:hypothetical protein